MMDRITGFGPVWDNNTKILILGSMPSVKSLEVMRYYGHSQNAFWPILTRLLDIPSDTPYDLRLKLMNLRGIGLWDVVQSCQRQGSSDSSITQVVPNDLVRCKKECPALICIAFNGKTAEKLFRRYFTVSDFGCIRLLSLPSTSPANAMLSREQKWNIWRDSLAPYLTEVLT